MVSKEEARKKVKNIVEEFLAIPKEKLNSMAEEQIKFRFIEPLFESLGWEKKDIEKEQRILKRRADYIMKIDNREVLVVEAKRTSIEITEKEGRQAVSYAYHKKIKFAVLTNFRQLRIYHALSNIRNINKNLLSDSRGYLLIDCENFDTQFDRLWNISKESFEKNEINNLLSTKDEKINKPIDESILKDLLQIREWLSKDLKKLRSYLNQEQIDEVVQILIDRIIFMRFVEDRELEDKDFLLNITKDHEQGISTKRLWEILKDKFRYFDEEYNSKLFCEGLLEKEGFFDDGTLIKMIKSMYFGAKNSQERYMFDEIPGDLLGDIYEQYLGTILRGTEKRVKLDQKSGKRKKMGIYYTPSYIVDYIVKSTVGEIIKNKNIDEILEIKIVDPACGSGSFLTRAFQEVCNKIEELMKRGYKSNKWKSFREFKGRLALNQKSTILQNCIYGVDLDEKAVELAQLNLLLKLLEDETKDTKRKVLPLMKDNIKCGNSLIDNSAIAGNKAFNWHAQFPSIFRNGGFDIVIGNPPYVRIQTLDNKETEYYKKYYKASGSGNYDIYVLFIERGLEFLNKTGKFGFILPHKFFNAKYGENIRKIISDGNHLEKIIHFGENQIFEGATTYTCLLFLSKESKNKFHFVEINDLEKWQVNNEFKELKIPANIATESEWNFSSESSDIIKKLRKIPNRNRLGDIANIFVGLQTSADKVYVMKKIKDDGNNVRLFSKELLKEVIIESEILKPFLKSSNIEPYSKPKICHNLIFPYEVEKDKVTLMDKNILNKKFPLCWKYLQECKNRLLSRSNVDKNNWWHYPYPKNLTRMEDIKLIIQVLSLSPRWIYDNIGLYMTGGGGGPFYGLRPKEDKTNIFFLMGILNSKLFGYVIANQSTKMRGGYIRFSKQYIENFPIQIANFSDMNQKSIHDNIVKFVTSSLSIKQKNNKNQLTEQQIKQLDWQINQEVYNLYGITKEEQKIIEESLK